MPGMPFGAEHHLALWGEYFARLLDDAAAGWQWRPPRPEDRKTVNPFLARAAAASFVPRSLAAARRLEAEAERVAAEPKPLPPFTEATAELASQAHRRQLAELEAEREAAARRAVEGCRSISDR
jgi:hypothetical protein